MRVPQRHGKTPPIPVPGQTDKDAVASTLSVRADHHDLSELAMLVDFLTTRQDLANLYSVLVQLIVAVIAVEAAALVYIFTPGTPITGDVTARILQYSVFLSGLIVVLGLFSIRKNRRNLTTNRGFDTSAEDVSGTVRDMVALVDRIEIIVRAAFLIPLCILLVMLLFQAIDPSAYQSTIWRVFGY